MWKLSKEALEKCAEAETLLQHGEEHPEGMQAAIRKIIRDTGDFPTVLREHGRKTTVITKIVGTMQLFSMSGRYYPKDLKDLRMMKIPDHWPEEVKSMWIMVYKSKDEDRIIVNADRMQLVTKGSETRPASVPYEPLPKEASYFVAGPGGVGVRMEREKSLFVDLGRLVGGFGMIGSGSMRNFDAEGGISINPQYLQGTLCKQTKEPDMAFKINVITQTYINGTLVDNLDNAGLLSLYEQAIAHRKRLSALDTALAKKELAELDAGIEKLEAVMNERADDSKCAVTKADVASMIQASEEKNL